MKAGSTAMTQRPRNIIPSGSMQVLKDSRRPDGANPPTNFDDPFFDSTGMIYMHWVPTGQTVNKVYYVEVLREFSKRFLGKRPALFKSGQWHFQQDNAPVHKSIFVTDYLTKMDFKFLSFPIVETLLPVTFAYSLSSEAVVMRQLRTWKRLWRRSLTRSHKRTSMGPSRSCWNDRTSALQPGEITSNGTRVSCVYYQQKYPYEKCLETYLMILVYIYIYICPYEKKSGNLFNDPRICIYINIYIYIYIQILGCVKSFTIFCYFRHNSPAYVVKSTNHTEQRDAELPEDYTPD